MPKIDSNTSAPQPHVPAGWKLVPIDPTDAMVEAGHMARMNIAGGYGGPGGWQAMLDAAPPSPSSLSTWKEIE
ncbi:hypothetical protein J2T08_003627 [Neorhizobium galegae]|uniref:hypothetical protein n=1 Tax=Neorhizobium galegae TaxID=399 RepID=UPI0027808B86|nr:hypothetical protein [Neorhizobium galegae]MDQ0135706.1 hypothetical protein [Neorhizobium galegae]